MELQPHAHKNHAMYDGGTVAKARDFSGKSCCVRTCVQERDKIGFRVRQMCMDMQENVKKNGTVLQKIKDILLTEVIS